MVQFNFNDKNAYGGGGASAKSAQAIDTKALLETAKQYVMKYKIEAACAAFVLVAAFVLFQYYNVQMKTITELDENIRILTEKEQPIALFKKEINADEELLASLPAVLPDNKLVTTLTFLANKSHILVTSLTPPESKDAGFYRLYTTQLSCQAGSFHEALMFIFDLERSEYALKIDSLKLSKLYQMTDKKRDIDVTIVVTSTEIVNNEKNKKNN